MAFKVPNDTPPRKTRFWIDETGQKWRSLGNAICFSHQMFQRWSCHLALEVFLFLLEKIQLLEDF